MLFDLLTPERILFGPGSTYRLVQEVARLGSRALLVSGRSTLQFPENRDRVLAPLKSSDLDLAFFEVETEPTTTMVDEGRRIAREHGAGFILGIGGGSVLDTAKAIAGLYHATEPTAAYMRGQNPDIPPIPWVALPTTAGSGSEVTRNAVLIDPESGRKASLRNEYWMARTAIVDPILTMSMPNTLTAYTGLDALTHAIEAYSSRWAMPPASALAAESVRLIVQNIYTAYSYGGKKEAREKMALASMMAGMAINSAGTGAVHALAHPIGIRYGLPHGLVCGMLLPKLMDFNFPLAVDAYAELGYRTGIAHRTSDSEEAARKFVLYVHKLVEKLGLPAKLGELGLKREDIIDIVATAMNSSSLSANVRKATQDDLVNILEQDLGNE